MTDQENNAGEIKAGTIDVDALAKGLKKYTGYGYHGGGRKKTGIKRVSICISGTPEEIQKLKEKAAEEGLTVSAFILKKTGIKDK